MLNLTSNLKNSQVQIYIENPRMFAMWLPFLAKFNFFHNGNSNSSPILGEKSGDSSPPDESSEIQEVAVCPSKNMTNSICRKLEPTVLVHGGAGNIPEYLVSRKLNCVKNAALAGYKVLKEGGSSEAAVEAAIKVMENDPVMNAGVGSVLNLEGKIESDACIMVGKTLDTGAITAVQDIANPISLARLVMEKTPHVLFASVGARKLACENGIPLADPDTLTTLAAKQALEEYKQNPEADLDPENIVEKKETDLDIFPRTESVGAVAIDYKGRIAVGASSGGWNGKTEGKFNEACSIGGGVYADDDMGGVSLTGE
ncbi:hypothetical protein HHI36_015806 [Cryptolaemus montrouzieri]|uniref:Isoaspartyl peptidase/L-asparaginase n=1 Tax=Cryptolaemus montrouzieri TaxID=559131 RepID=A0ABD2N7W8_9CUCU